MWKRKIILEVLSQEGEILLTFSEHRVDFTYFSLVGGNVADTCEVKIFNIGDPNVFFLADKTRDKTSSLLLRIRAGYQDEFLLDADLPVLIEGEIMGVSGQRILPEHVTTLYCVPKEGRVFNSLTRTIIAKEPIPLRDLLTEFMKQVGINEVLFQVSKEEEAVLDTEIKNYSDKGTVVEILNKLTSQHHLLYNLSSGQLVVRTIANEQELFRVATEQERNTSDGQGEMTIEIVGVAPRIWKLNSNLLRGTPSIEISKFHAVVALDFTRKPLDIIDVSKINGEDATAGEFPLMGLGNTALGQSIYRDKEAAHYTTSPYYQIKELTHVGSNYTATWETTIQAFMYRDNMSDNDNVPLAPITIS